MCWSDLILFRVSPIESKYYMKFRWIVLSISKIDHLKHLGVDNITKEKSGGFSKISSIVVLVLIIRRK
jgi:hypothetical protein